MTKQKRFEAMLLGHQPRYVRCYDSGPDGSVDRYTAVYTGKWGGDYVSMSAYPYHPQGIAQHGEGLIDRDHNGWPPALGRKNQLGTRIQFWDLPVQCQTLVLQEYCKAWKLDFKEALAYCDPNMYFVDTMERVITEAGFEKTQDTGVLK